MNSINETPEPDYPSDAAYVPADAQLVAERTTSPKVIAGAAVGLLLAVVVAVLAAVTPDMLDGLGAWAPLAFVAITTLATQLGAYLKRDPLREQ